MDLVTATLIVLGVNPRPGETLYLGAVPERLMREAECGLLLVGSE